MKRRQVLQTGALLSLLPLAGCGASEPSPPAVTPAPPSPPPAPPPPSTAAQVAPAPAPETKEPPPPSAPSAPEAPRSPFTRVSARLGKNHGHELVVDFADVLAGVEKTYEIRGKANHPHEVTLTAEHLQRLLAGELVRTKSSTGLHAHRVVVRCAPPVDPPEWVSVVKFSSSGADEHEIVVTAADMEAKVEKSYDVQGLAGHGHTVTLTAADFDKLTRGGPVTHQTTREPGDSHLHTVTIEYRRPKV